MIELSLWVPRYCERDEPYRFADQRLNRWTIPSSMVVPRNVDADRTLSWTKAVEPFRKWRRISVILGVTGSSRPWSVGANRGELTRNLERDRIGVEEVRVSVGSCNLVTGPGVLYRRTNDSHRLCGKKGRIHSHLRLRRIELV